MNIKELIEADGRYLYSYSEDLDREEIRCGSRVIYVGHRSPNIVRPTMIVSNHYIGDVHDIIIILGLKPYTYIVQFAIPMSSFMNDVIRPYYVYYGYKIPTEFYTGEPIRVIHNRSDEVTNVITYEKLTGIKEDFNRSLITYPSGTYNTSNGEDTGTGFIEYFDRLAMTVLP